MQYALDIHTPNVNNSRVLRFLRLLFGHDCPSRREMLATRDACDALEARVEQHYSELKALRGKVNAMRRWEAAEDAKTDPQSRQVAPGRTISPPRPIPRPPAMRNYGG